MVSPIITAALLFLTLSTNVLAADFIGLARDDSQAWFLSASDIARQPNGEIQTDVYQVYRDGRTMGGRAAHFADFRIAYDCAGKTWHPVKIAFFDEAFSLIGSSDLTNAAPKPVTSENAWGPAYACDPSKAAATRRLSGKDWREVASILYTHMGPGAQPTLKPSQRALADWGSCLADASAPFIGGQLSPEAVADTALEKCRELEQKFNLALTSEGATASDIVAQRAQTRETIIRSISTTRTGGPLTPRSRWFKCVGSASVISIDGSDPPELLIDRAFETCKPEEAAALHAFEQEMPAAKASELMGQLKAAIRDQSIPYILQQRSKKP
ncbi:MAG TPA: hypothetical protein VGL66_04665 [Caulobacteraceae bacterium]|jgi:hypothetical protein